MSTATTEAFSSALDAVFEGRECQFGEGPRKLLRALYDRAREDERKNPVSKAGKRVKTFGDLKVGDVFQNDYLAGEGRARRVIRVLSSDRIETEYVSTRSGRVVRTDAYDRDTFEEYHNYRYIDDPTA